MLLGVQMLHYSSPFELNALTQRPESFMSFLYKFLKKIFLLFPWAPYKSEKHSQT